MRLILFFLFILYFNLSHSQSLRPTKKEVIKLLKSTVQRGGKVHISTEVSWNICNQDSSYYKKDTIDLLFNNHGDCCAFISWSFYKPTAFAETSGQTCQEPSSMSGTSNFFNLRIGTDSKNITFLVEKNDKTISRFRVLRISNDSFKKIQLVRIK